MIDVFIPRYLVGILGNQGDLDEAAALKGAHFVRICTMREIPLIFLVNTPSDPDFLAPQGTSGRVAKARAQMMSVVATSLVPKLTIVLGGSYGPSAFAMVRQREGGVVEEILLQRWTLMCDTINLSCLVAVGLFLIVTYQV